MRLHEIRLHALPQSQHHPQSHLSIGVALLRGSGQPFESFVWISRTAFPFEQHHGEVQLSQGIPTEGSFAVPLRGALGIFRQVASFVMEGGQFKLQFGKLPSPTLLNGQGDLFQMPRLFVRQPAGG